MPSFSLPQIYDGMSHDELLNAVAQMGRAFSYYLNNLDNKNILEMDGQKLFASSVPDGKIIDVNGVKLQATTVNGQQKLIALSVTDGQVNDLNGSKNWALSVANGSLASGIDGAKMLSLSVADAALLGMNGAKLNALSVSFGKINNVKLSGTQAYTLTAGQQLTFIITHQSINGLFEPRIRKYGTADDFYYSSVPDLITLDVINDVRQWCTYHGNGLFQIALKNHSTGTVSGSIEWYRYGILD